MCITFVPSVYLGSNVVEKRVMDFRGQAIMQLPCDSSSTWSSNLQGQYAGSPELA